MIKKALAAIFEYEQVKQGLKNDPRPLVFQRSYKLKEEDRSNDCQTSLSP